MKKKLSAKITILSFFLFITISPVVVPKKTSAVFGENSNNLLVAKPQKRTKRIWKNLEIEPLLTLSKFKNLRFAYPLKIKTDSKSNIYILDAKIGSLFKYSSKGAELTQYGSGIGQGPGEFMQPFDFSIDTEGNVYISDVRTNRVTIFKQTGQMKRLFNLQVSPQSVLPDNTGGFITSTSTIGGSLQKYDGNGKEISTFGKFLEQQSTYPVPLGIKLVGNAQYFYGIFFRAGYLIKYSLDGQLLYFRNTMDEVPFPLLKINPVDNSVGISFGPKTPRASLDISITDSIIYILSIKSSHQEHAVVLDAYKDRTGDYLYSIKFNKMAGVVGILSCVIDRNYMYTIEFTDKGKALAKKYQIKIM